MRNRNIVVYYAFSFLIGLYLASGTTVLFERQLGLSFSQIFTLDAIYMLMFILFEIPTGALADLIGRKKTLIVGSLALVVAAIATGNVHTFLQLFLTFFIWAFGFSLISGSGEAMLYDSLKDEKLYQRIYGRASSLSIIGMALAGALGPQLYDHFFRLPYLLSSIPFALGAIVILFFHEAAWERKGFSLHNHVEQIKIGTTMAFRNHYILWSMTALSLVFAVSYTFTSSYQPYLQQIGYSVRQFSFIIPVMFLIEAGGGWISERMSRFFGETISFRFNFFALGISLLALGFFANRFVVPILFFYGFLQGVLRPLLSTYANRYIDSEHRATVISVQGMFSTITASALLFAFGFLADRIGVIALAGVIGGMVLVVGSVLLYLQPRSSTSIQ